MLDRRRRADLEGAQALGRLSDEMVFSLGRAVRGGLAEEDLRVFARAADLFELLATGDEGVPPESRSQMMLGTNGYLDALQVVQERAQDDEIEAYVRRFVELLHGIIERRSALEEERTTLEALRELFVEVGEATLSRAGELSLPQEAHWPSLRQATT